jgi:hypothetical protein
MALSQDILISRDFDVFIPPPEAAEHIGDEIRVDGVRYKRLTLAMFVRAWQAMQRDDASPDDVQAFNRVSGMVPSEWIKQARQAVHRGAAAAE